MKKIIITASIIGLIASANAFAAGDAVKKVTKGSFSEAFAVIDADKDGKVSQKEFDASGIAKTEKVDFKALDANKDGNLTLEEVSVEVPAPKAK